MRHSLIMSFSRPNNLPIYMRYLRGQGVDWRPLCSQLDHDGYEWDCKSVFSGRAEAWIKPWHCRIPTKAMVDASGGRSCLMPAVNPGNYIVDKFMDEMKADPTFFDKDHYLSFLTDDCLWSHDHWRKLHEGMKAVRWDALPGINAAVEAKWKDKTDTPHVIISAYKMGGNEMPATYVKVQSGMPWETWQRNSCRLYITKCEVLTVRADCMKGIYFGPLWCSDGLLVEQLCEEHEGRLMMHNSSFIYPECLNPEVFGFPHHKR